MYVFILFFFLSQDKPAIKPITPGNVIPYGSYQVTVPDNAVMISEEDAPFIYESLAISNVPQGVGLMFPGEDPRECAVILQHFPFQPYKIEETLADTDIIALYSTTHMVYNKPTEDQMEIIVPPVFDETDQSFMFGVRYRGAETDEAFIRKVWVSDQDAFMMTLTAQGQAFDTFTETVFNIFEALDKNPTYETIDLSAEPQNYLDLLGISRTVETEQISLEEALLSPEDLEIKISPWIYAFSGVMIVMAIALLFFAFKLKKKAQAEALEKKDAVS